MPSPLERVRKASRKILVSPHRSTDAELLDQSVQDQKELAENFRDIRRVNQLLGGTSVVLRHLPRLIAPLPASPPVTILDLATGTADIPLAILRWSKRQRRPVQIVASDISEDILALAREETSGHPEISIAHYDARSVPLPDHHFDIVLCSLSLHHFAPDDATQVLREMRRLARHGVILNDLYRSRVGFGAAWIAARLTTRNRLTRNDAPLSVRRAYTPKELHQLMHRAGYQSPKITQHLWFRMAAVERGSAV